MLCNSEIKFVQMGLKSFFKKPFFRFEFRSPKSLRSFVLIGILAVYVFVYTVVYLYSKIPVVHQVFLLTFCILNHFLQLFFNQFLKYCRNFKN